MPRSGPGRPSVLDDDDNLKLVAEMFAAGASRQDIADAFNIKDLYTISKWRRNPRVKAATFKLIEDRILEVTRKVDASIAGRLQKANELTVKELLDIRKEFLGGALRAQTERADDETINEAATWLDENPEAAKQLERMLAGKAPIPGVEAPVEGE